MTIPFNFLQYQYPNVTVWDSFWGFFGFAFLGDFPSGFWTVRDGEVLLDAYDDNDGDDDYDDDVENYFIIISFLL